MCNNVYELISYLHFTHLSNKFCFHGSLVSDWYGYGLMDAQALIAAAQNWTCLQAQHTCQSGIINVNKYAL